MSRRNVLIMGLGSYLNKHPSQISKLTPSTIAEKVSATKAEAATLGFDCENLEVDPDEPESTVQRLKEKLASKEGGWAAVSIGFGVRGQPQFTKVFEDVVNTVRVGAPGARFIFSLGPDKVVEGIRRVFPDVPRVGEEKGRNEDLKS